MFHFFHSLSFSLCLSYTLSRSVFIQNKTLFSRIAFSLYTASNDSCDILSNEIWMKTNIKIVWIDWFEHWITHPLAIVDIKMRIKQRKSVWQRENPKESFIWMEFFFTCTRHTTHDERAMSEWTEKKRVHDWN